MYQNIFEKESTIFKKIYFSYNTLDKLLTYALQTVHFNFEK